METIRTSHVTAALLCLLASVHHVTARVCKGLEEDEFIHGKNINDFNGCTMIDGDLRIMEGSFLGDRYRNYPAIEPSQLSIFESVTDITGHLIIQGEHRDLDSLDFLSNLRIIRGRTLSYVDAALQIYGTSISQLGLKSLEEISRGSIVIGHNEQLCYVNAINWQRLFQRSNQKVSIRFNRDQARCDEDMRYCDEECTSDGCWGPGEDQCLACAHYTYEDKCVRSCYNSWGLYLKSGTTMCGRCHPDCEECYGPGAEQCEKCKDYNDDGRCVKECARSKFADYNNECQECHPQCQNGCDGYGADDCFECRAYMDNKACVDECPTNKYPDTYNICQFCNSECVGGCNGPSSRDCVSFNTRLQDGSYVDQCPLEMYRDPYGVCRMCSDQCRGGCVGPGTDECLFCTHVTDKGHCVHSCPRDKFPDQDAICRPCHVECSEACIGPDADNCVACRNVKDGNECVPECPEFMYPDDNADCQACSMQCRHGCYGPTASDCIACRSYKEGGRCVTRCPVGSCPDDENNCGPCAMDLAMPSYQELVEKVNDLQSRQSRGWQNYNNGPVIAFTAYAQPDRVDYFTGDHLMFDRVITNIGNAYDPEKSTFTCPRAGVYMFAVSVDNYMRASLVPSIYKERKTREGACSMHLSPTNTNPATANQTDLHTNIASAFNQSEEPSQPCDQSEKLLHEPVPSHHRPAYHIPENMPSCSRQELIASAGAYNSASQTVTLQCAVDEQVFVRTSQSGTMFNQYGWRTSTFTGYLIADRY